MRFTFLRFYFLGSWVYFFLTIANAQTRIVVDDLDPRRPLNQYMAQQWTTDDGLLSNNILNVYQDYTGYLWFTTYDGLNRFDGANFASITRRNLLELNTNAIYVVAQSKDSTLWLGTQGSGLLAYKNGEVTPFGGEEYYIQTLFFDSKGKLWIGTRGNGVFLFENNTFKPMEFEPLLTISVNFVGEDASGNLWFGTEGAGIIEYNGKEFTHFAQNEGLENLNVNHILFEEDGSMLISTYAGLFEFKNTKFTRVEALGNQGISKTLRDRHNSLWVAGWDQGLQRWNPLTNTFEVFNSESNLAYIEDFQFDHENNLWIATKRDGVFRLKAGKFLNYTQQEGLEYNSVGSVAEYAPNAYLVGLNNGLVNLVKNGEVQPFPLKTKLNNDRIYDIHKDRHGTLWFSTYQGLLKKEVDGTETFLTQADGLSGILVRMVYEDQAGNIWVGTRDGGITIFKTDGTLEILNRANGLTSDFIMSIEGDAQGNIWIGTNNGGINIVSPERKIKTLTTQNGLASNLVFDINIDKKGVVWIVGNGGISRLHNEKIVNFSSRNGLPSDSPFGFLEDDFGGVWLPTSRGISYVEKEQLNQFAEGVIDTLSFALYGKEDGMKSEQCVGATHSIIDADGNMVIPTFGGIVVVNPKQILQNTLPPPVDIHTFTVDGKAIDLQDKNIKLPSGHQRLVFGYSGLSLEAPSKVEFRYRISPYDKRWVRIGTERQAVYTGLPKGTYTFQVIAANNDGVWNTTGDTLTFSVAPYWYETTLFRVSALVASILLIASIFLYRTRRIERRNRQLEKLVDERTTEVKQINALLEEKHEAIEVQHKEINQQKVELEKRNQAIIASMNYAYRIQASLMPRPQEVIKHLRDGFIFYVPRDIVSGDFYWSTPQTTSQGDQVLVLVAADCTGHGIPGALLSIVGNDMLNEIVVFQKITSPKTILTQLNQRIKTTLRQKETQNRDGIEMGICVLNFTQQTLTFGGARRPLVVVADGKVEVIQASKSSIGGNFLEKEQTFTEQNVHWSPWASYYMFSDGFQDQFGGKEGKKYMAKRFKTLLSQISAKSMEAQQVALEKELFEWRKPSPNTTYNQVDDILVIGFQLPT